PGNPVSAIVTFVLLVGTALRGLLGANDPDHRATAVIDRDYTKAPGRAHALRCRLSAGEDGWHAEPTAEQGSHILTSMLGADALAALSEMQPLGELLSRLPVQMAVNRDYASSDTTLASGDELALIPPVSGGSEEPAEGHAEGQRLHVRVSQEPLSLDRLSRAV